MFASTETLQQTQEYSLQSVLNQGQTLCNGPIDYSWVSHETGQSLKTSNTSPSASLYKRVTSQF